MKTSGKGSKKASSDSPVFTLAGESYVLAEQSEEFKKLAEQVVYFRTSLRQRMLDIEALRRALDSSRRELLDLVGAPNGDDGDFTLPESLSFESSD